MNQERKNQLINLCRKMIQTPSVTGNEERLVNLLKMEMHDRGYDEVKVDCLGNIIGKINGSGNGKTLLFDGHLDTVAITKRSSWRKEPFGAELESGRIYGRGASDMKGALAAMIQAGADAKQDGQITGDIYVSGTVCEEVAEGYSLNSVIDATVPDIVVIGEATSLNLNIGQRGRAEIEVKTKGVPAHSSHPEIGVNAVYHMMNFINRIRDLSEITCEILGKGNMVLTDIISSPYPGASVIPELCIATFDRRLLTGETEESVLAPLRKCITEMANEDSDFKAEVSIAETKIKTYTRYEGMHRKIAPAWLMEQDHPVVQDSLQALKDFGFTDIGIGTYSFCTNGSCSAGMRNIPTIGFGPGKEEQAHVNDEFIEVQELEGAYKGYYALMKAFAGE
ncbi:MAG: YgeY family selenium metabolism-linked hydrolase [Bacteroidetes bacterium]|nr:YgeY family selenium metabolism-linked hydrolase [Bacteroidota bacterium]